MNLFFNNLLSKSSGSGGSTPEPSATYDVFIVAGQSNTDGRVPYDDENAPTWISDKQVDGIKVWSGSFIKGFFVDDYGDSGNGSSWKYGSASLDNYSYASVAGKLLADEGKNVLFCQVTQGGTGIAESENERGTWSYNYDDKTYPDIVYLLEDLKNRFLDLVTYATVNNIQLNIKGIIWHQGEGDTGLTYEVDFAALIADIRDWTGVSDLPIFYGTISHNSAQYTSAVETAQLAIASSDENAYCRDNSELTLLDDYHFDASSSYTFGEWVANTILSNLY